MPPHKLHEVHNAPQQSDSIVLLGRCAQPIEPDHAPQPIVPQLLIYNLNVDDRRRRAITARRGFDLLHGHESLIPWLVIVIVQVLQNVTNLYPRAAQSFRVSDATWYILCGDLLMECTKSDV